MNEQSPRLIIIGASTRAAAWSAWRAGYRPICVYAFADRDLLQVAEVIPSAYPAGIAESLSEISADGWMFVGAMENHRGVLRELQRLPRLGRYFGPSLSAIDALRDPLWLSERLRPLGCYPEVVNHREEKWLMKPLHGGGGLGIREAEAGPLPAAHYLQRYVSGTPMSTLYRITSIGAERLMVCEQLIGLPEAAPPGPFVFCGAITVPTPSAEQAVQLDRIVSTLADSIDYRGLIGIDLVWDGTQFWVIEINPRYTASTELWELTTRQSAVAAHLAAFDDAASQYIQSRVQHDSRILGKAILYADCEVIAPNLDRFLAARLMWSVPWLADIPATGAVVSQGAPINTVFASGTTQDECQRRLVRRLQRVRTWMTPASSMLLPLQ